MQPREGSRVFLRRESALPTETINEEREAALRGLIRHIAHSNEGVLQMRGDDLQISFILRKEPQHVRFRIQLCRTRRISAPQRDSFSSSRSRPRLRWTRSFCNAFLSCFLRPSGGRVAPP